MLQFRLAAMHAQSWGLGGGGRGLATGSQEEPVVGHAGALLDGVYLERWVGEGVTEASWLLREVKSG